MLVYENPNKKVLDIKLDIEDIVKQFQYNNKNNDGDMIMYEKDITIKIVESNDKFNNIKISPYGDISSGKNEIVVYYDIFNEALKILNKTIDELNKYDKVYIKISDIFDNSWNYKYNGLVVYYPYETKILIEMENNNG